MTRVLVDADPLVYSNGFAAEKRVYKVTWIEVDPDDPDNEEADTIHEHEFTYKKDYNDWRLDQGFDGKEYDDLFILDRAVIPEPLPNALHLVRTALENIRAAVGGALAETGDKVDEFLLYLSGSENFRYDIATIKPYKGNRDPSHKPFWYKEIRQYMVDVWGAEIVEPWEADDKVAMLQTDDPDGTILCTIDKDLRMIPGTQYNYRTKEFITIDWDEALINFYRQLVAGDNTDNIGGVYKAGKKTAEQIIMDGMTEEEMYEQALAAYQASIDKYGTKTGYDHLGAEAALLENARLLWMIEYPGQLWTPPGQPEALWEPMSDD